MFFFFIGGSPRFPLRPSHSRSKRQRSGSLQRRSKKVKENIIYLFNHKNIFLILQQPSQIETNYINHHA